MQDPDTCHQKGLAADLQRRIGREIAKPKPQPTAVERLQQASMELRFELGQIVGPLGGAHWMVVGIDPDEQVLAIKPVKAVQRAAGRYAVKRKRKRRVRR